MRTRFILLLLLTSVVMLVMACGNDSGDTGFTAASGDFRAGYEVKVGECSLDDQSYPQAELVVHNPYGHEVTVIASVDFLDSSGNVVGNSGTGVLVKPGDSVTEVVHGLDTPPGDLGGCQVNEEVATLIE